MDIISENFKTIFEQNLINELKECKIVKLSANTVLLNQGSYIKLIPLVLKGVIKVFKTDDSGKEILLYTISGGESCILSITSSLNNKISHADAVTQTGTEIILVTSEQNRNWMEKYNTWRKYIVKLYYNRLTELLSLVDEIAFKKMDERLLEKLKEKSAKGNVIKITHQQLANELGTAREVISRLLKQLEKNNIISISRGKIILK